MACECIACSCKLIHKSSCTLGHRALSSGSQILLGLALLTVSTLCLIRCAYRRSPCLISRHRRDEAAAQCGLLKTQGHAADAVDTTLGAPSLCSHQLPAQQRCAPARSRLPPEGLSYNDILHATASALLSCSCARFPFHKNFLQKGLLLQCLWSRLPLCIPAAVCAVALAPLRAR